MGGRLATCSIVAVGLGFALVLAILLVPGRAWAGDDDLVLDLGSASDKPSEAGAGLRKLELRRIQKGTFVEGSPASDAYREPDEVQRNVTISKTYWMGKYPITRGQFARFVAETRHQTDAEKGQSGGFGWDGVHLKQAKEYTWRSPGFTQSDDDPVTLVTFGDANAFTAWASRKTGRRVRLPTEAEFEFAARGGTTTPWFAAKSEDEAIALGWYRPQPGQSVGTHPVGKKKANPFGLYDMAGNVNEWCRDVYAVWPTADATDPENTTNATSEPERRVLRGGSWLREAKRARSAARFRNAPGARNADNGFRVVVEDAPVIAPAPGAATSADLAPSASPMSDNPAAPPAIDAGPMIQATPVVQRSPSTEGSAWVLLAAPAAGISFVVAWMLVRRKKEATNAQGITTRAGEDGFWVRAPNLPPNSRVRYTCLVKGSEVSDIVPLDGGEETFVFTGGAPSLIHITEAVAVPGHRSSARMPVAAPIPPPPPSSVPPAPPSPGVSPWPSDRGSVRSVGAMPASSVPPLVPSRPPVPPPPSSAPLTPSSPPPVPPSSRSPAPPSAPPPVPSPTRAPLAPAVPPAPPSSSRALSTPPAPPSSSRAPLAPSMPPAPPSSRSPAAPSVPPPLPSSRPSSSRAPSPLSKPPLPPALAKPPEPFPFLLPPVEVAAADDDKVGGPTVLADEPDAGAKPSAPKTERSDSGKNDP